MKATCLMIGDWVLAEGKLTQVTDIDEYDGINRRWIAGCEDGGCIYEGDIKPIPITAEILNKNKFPYVPLANGWFIGGLFLKGENGLYSVGANIRIEDIGVYYTFTQIQYIHELQHLMHLLKIEKDIKI